MARSNDPVQNATPIASGSIQIPLGSDPLIGTTVRPLGCLLARLFARPVDGLDPDATCLARRDNYLLRVEVVVRSGSREVGGIQLRIVGANDQSHAEVIFHTQDIQ